MTIRLQVAADLRFLLPRLFRADGRPEFNHDPDATVGHVVQSAGIPLTEVGVLHLDGEPVDPTARPGRGSVIAVEPVERPQPLRGPPTVLLDVHLGALARRLRLLGVDTAYGNDATDTALVAQAQQEDRLLLSQDRGLLRRRAIRRAAYVRGQRPDDQLADVLDRFRLPLSPFTRCMVCNGVLAPVPKGQVRHVLEPGTLRTQEDFSQCGACGRVYWRGAHAARLDEIVGRYSGGASRRPPD